MKFYVKCLHFLKKTCKCKNHVVKKDEDIFDKFERVSRQWNMVMLEEYLKEIRNYINLFYIYNVRNYGIKVLLYRIHIWKIFCYHILEVGII